MITATFGYVNKNTYKNYGDNYELNARHEVFMPVLHGF